MTADVDQLRRDAKLARETAEAATKGRWCTGWDRQEFNVYGGDADRPTLVAEWTYAVATSEPQASRDRAECDTQDAAHIALFDPTVALAVADILDETAHSLRAEQYPDDPNVLATYASELDLARKLLREEAP